MKRIEITVVFLLGGLLFSTGVKAVVTNTKDNPYNVIIERNVFGLKPPPPPPTNEAPPPPPATEVKLSGITSIIDPPRAILLWKEPVKPGTPPGKEESYIFREGDKQGIIEVLEINVKAGSVKIKNGGEPMLLTFETHGAKLPNTPLPPPAPGALPGALPHPAAAAAPGNVNATRNLGLGANNRFPGGNPKPAASGVNPTSSGLPTIPTRQLRSAPDSAAVVPQPPAMTPETQTILMEIERERTKAQVQAGELPPLPPTELTPESPEGQ